MSIVFEKYLITFLCFLVCFFVIKYVQTKKIIKQDREYFIKTLSHDIRVAIIAQIRGLELLQKNLPANNELIKDLDYNCQYTLDMVSMLINNYKYKNDELFLNYEPISLPNLLLSTIRNLNGKSKGKSIQIDYYNQPSVIMADKIWITKALHIILSVILDLSYGQKKIICSIKDAGKHVKLEFKYTGRTLTDEEYNKMFSGDTKYSTVGFGIKMHMLKNILNMHSGNIKIIKTFDNINTFSIVLPAKMPITRKNTLIKRFQLLCYKVY